MSSPALSPELSEKNKKYDRQLRYVRLLQTFFHHESTSAMIQILPAHFKMIGLLMFDSFAVSIGIGYGVSMAKRYLKPHNYV